MRQYRLSTLLLLVVIAALTLAAIDLQRRLSERERELSRLNSPVGRQEQHLRRFATSGRERDEMLHRYEGLKGYFDMQANREVGP